ncbi:hypothetical protein NIIDNTM18_23480 [Mycolicibacterium litorale]|uniref:Uncharacterized protein n=1 Tax=Mycolicibacterium litorale TaxID=758802 RepID=A0A6S6P8N4_9MYCO|nr:hypothetical protein NIIDNTM18_23480 [Mycolicibacterium litorale]
MPFDTISQGTGAGVGGGGWASEHPATINATPPSRAVTFRTDASFRTLRR